MDILLCCEHFYPSVGGVQKMMHEIGVRFIKKGHNVTVVTSWRRDRINNTIDGIKIKSFHILKVIYQILLLKYFIQWILLRVLTVH